MRNRFSKRFFKCCKGGFALETAIILPFVVLLAMGTINISRYVLTQGALSKATDSLANVLTMAKTYDDNTDLGHVTDDDNYDYITQQKLDNLVNSSVPLLIRGYDNAVGTHVVISSVSRKFGEAPIIRWQRNYSTGTGDTLGEGAIINIDSADPATCVGVCIIARDMLEGESLIAVEMYQDFVPGVFFGVGIPVIGRSTIYSATAYSPRFGSLDCLHPNPSPYAGQC